jgi:hypothetical protein
MTLSIYFLLTFCILGIVILSALRQHRREQNLTSGWQSVDLQALARLLDKHDDDFLADHLSSVILLRLRIHRALVAEHYLERLNANSEYAIAVAKLNPAEDDLLVTATALHMEVAKLRWKVWLAVLWPSAADVQKLASLTRFFDEKRFSIQTLLEPIHS